jgi:hypothetical protein
MSASIPRASPETTRIAVQRRRDIKESSKENVDLVLRKRICECHPTGGSVRDADVEYLALANKIVQAPGMTSSTDVVRPQVTDSGAGVENLNESLMLL